MKFTPNSGSTPIDIDSLKDLIPSLVTQSQLNAFEQTNISAATDWANKSRKLKATLLTVDGILLLHHKMFGQTLQWAGQFRRKDLNIGISWSQIPEQMKNLLDDVSYWEENATFDATESAVRIHHRLVQIHPFLNGNGRLSRLAADLFLLHRKATALTWGGKINLTEGDQIRREYIAALQEADQGNYERLIEFATRIG